MTELQRVFAKSKSLFIVLMSASVLMTGSESRANGDLFFEAMEVPGQPEYVIFGSIRDSDGKYLDGALVTVNVKEPRLVYSIESGLLGRYRTLDVGRAITGLGYDVDPGKIEVSVALPGYRVERSLNRGRRGQTKGAIEINFVMKKESS